ncbi:UNVERIFIED_CONTAM: hypothetical protein Slati_1381800 [Sesamum latifolium]|uniref:Transposase-associated domain-containing protein n=1 Tax=Sesamum latifolium TaxID=2727402 RepID=A0AAW2X2X4_9LAMI
MYNKNLLDRAGLTPVFEDGVKTFIEWAIGDKIRCPCRKCKNTKFRTPDEVSYHLCMRGFTIEYYNWTFHGEESVPEYFEAATVPPMSAEPTPTAHVEANSHPHWGDEQHMDWVQRMIFYAVGPSYFSSCHDGVSNDGTRSCSIDIDHSEYCYGGGPYDYESGLADRFANVVHVADQLLWNRCTQHCTQSQLGVVAELVDIKADGHISERIYDRISQWDNRILPPGHTLPGDHYNTKKLIKDLGLPVEKIGACKNGCMLY